MDNTKQTPESSHIRSREAAEVLNNPDKAIKDLENSMVAYLGGAETDAQYEDYPSDHALRTTKVERRGGKLEDGWLILGEATNKDGAKVYKVGRLDDEGRLLAKPATPEQIISWNTPETRSPAVIEQSLGRIGLRLSSGEAMPTERFNVVDAPVAQLDETDRAYDNLLNPDYDDGLTNQQRIEAAAFDPRSDEEKAQDAWNRVAREADHKDSLAKQTERLRGGGN